MPVSVSAYPVEKRKYVRKEKKDARLTTSIEAYQKKVDELCKELSGERDKIMELYRQIGALEGALEKYTGPRRCSLCGQPRVAATALCLPPVYDQNGVPLELSPAGRCGRLECQSQCSCRKPSTPL